MKKFLFLAPLLISVGGGIATPTRRLGPTGTHDLAWLRANGTSKLSTISASDLERIANTELAAHNRRMNSMVSAFAVRVDKRDGVDATGVSLTGTMTEVDEYGRARTQTTKKPGDTNFPLRRYQFAAGYTSDFFRKKTARDFVAVLENAQAAHRKAVVKEIRDRIFSPSNYDFEDFLTDGKVFNVKGFYNADGTAPPMGPNLEEFLGTHNHYLGFTALNGAALDSMIDGVREHNENAVVEVHVNAMQEGALLAIPGFARAQEVNVQVSVNDTVATRTTDRAQNNNRFLGTYRGADVWAKPWVFANYGYALDTSDPVLGIRHPDDVEDEGLRMIGQIVSFPLQSDYWGAEFGIGVRRRGGAVVAQFNSPTAGTYQDPTGRSW